MVEANPIINQAQEEEEAVQENISMEESKGEAGPV
jgi:hypothetical protein